MSTVPAIIDADYVDITPARLPVVRVNRLPTIITNERINAATLPTVISAAQQAIARCTDLPQLLEYRDKAEGLAAAVRVMKHVGPDMVRKANEMMADAWRKGGELLSQYSSVRQKVGAPGASSRMRIAKVVGLNATDVNNMVRISEAPKVMVYKEVATSSSLKKVASRLPRTESGKNMGRPLYGDACRAITHGPTGAGGLNRVLSCAKEVPLVKFKQLAPDERKVVKAKITEIMELLDEMDRLCK